MQHRGKRTVRRTVRRTVKAPTIPGTPSPGTGLTGQMGTTGTDAQKTVPGPTGPADN